MLCNGYFKKKTKNKKHKKNKVYPIIEEDHIPSIGTCCILTGLCIAF